MNEVKEIVGCRYVLTCRALELLVREAFPLIEPSDTYNPCIGIDIVGIQNQSAEELWNLRKDTARYLLWMLGQIPSIEDPEKRGRWIGWVFGASQFIGICNIDQARELIRQDRDAM